MMTTSKSVRVQKRSMSDKMLKFAVWFAAILVLLLTATFSGYYYWDRYIYVSDKSPIELNIEHFEEAIRDDPQNADNRVALAEFYLSNGKNQNAVDQVTQVLAAYPEHQGALLIAGIAHSRLDEPDLAVEPLEKLVSARQNEPMAGTDNILQTAYYFLGNSYLALDRPEAAIAVLESAIEINHTDADAFYILGQAYNVAGQPRKALENFERAVLFVPDFTEAYAGMISSYNDLHEPEYVAYARGMHALSLQDVSTAQTHLEYTVEALPEFAPAYVGLAMTYEKLGELDQAMNAIQHALQLAPDNFAANQLHGRLQALLNSHS